MSVFIINPGSPRDERHIPLATSKKWPIPNERFPEGAMERMLDAEKKMKALHPTITTRSLSATYNCGGLVFGARRTCIDAEHFQKILDDDGYQLLVDQKPERGDVIAYRKTQGGNIEHVGVVLRLPTQGLTGLFHGGPLLPEPMLILSQWGRDGEYIHEPEHVPSIYGTVRAYYSERRK